jgi:hypothetical protein
MLKAAELEGLAGNTFNLAGDVRLTAREYIAYLREFSHRRIKAFAYPTVLCYLSDTIKYLIKCFTGDRNALLSYRDLANRSIQGHFDCETEERLLSWQPCDNRNEFVTKAIGWAFRGS